MAVICPFFVSCSVCFYKTRNERLALKDKTGQKMTGLKYRNSLY